MYESFKAVSTGLHLNGKFQYPGASSDMAL